MPYFAKVPLDFTEVETTLNLFAAFAQSLDEDIDGRAGTDTDMYRFSGTNSLLSSGNAFQFVLSNHDVFPNRLGIAIVSILTLHAASLGSALQQHRRLRFGSSHAPQIAEFSLVCL